MADTKEHVTVEVPKPLYARVRDYADRRGIKLRWIVRQALEQYLRNPTNK